MRSLDDRTKVRIFKALTIVLASSVIKQSVVYNFMITAYSVRAERNLRKLQLANRIVHRFVDLSSQEVLEQIRKEFEFDMVTVDLDFPDDEGITLG
jgi:tRNA A58 N-methylase Trm61